MKFFKDRKMLQLLAFVTIISFLSSEVTGLQWEYVDGDGIVMEAPHEDLLQVLKPLNGSHIRTKRQFPSGFHFPQFPAGWPFIQHHQQPIGGGGGGIHQQQQGFQQFPGFPGFPAQQMPAMHQTTTTTTPPPPVAPTRPPSQMGNCVTRNGFQGKCAAFRQCFPYVFSSNEGEADVYRNPGLAADLRDRAGSCDTQSTMPNYFVFRADVQARQNMICCGNGQIHNATATAQHQYPGINHLFHPQITMRPPWALWSSTARPATTTYSTTTWRTTTTQRTTQRPQTQRTTTSQNLWPNWPPPFITHPPHHFQPQTTRRPAEITHWPGPVQQTTPRPPSAAVTTPQPVVQPPVSSSCGYSKIVGGQQASKSEFPWLVAIMRNGRQICGASLIDSQWILSAAHCFDMFRAYDLQSLRVQIGDYDIYSHADGPVTVRGVSKIIKHRGFSGQLLHNDIALLKLDSPVQLGSNGNNNIQPICLSKTGGYEGTTATVAGWGGIYEGGPQPPTYRKVNLPVWNNRDCASKYGHMAPGGITSNMVCAGSPNSDACRGDSGGPLMRNNGGRWEQIGIVSWGIGCGKLPGVYTRIDHYQDWIQTHRRH